MDIGRGREGTGEERGDGRDSNDKIVYFTSYVYCCYYLDTSNLYEHRQESKLGELLETLPLPGLLLF